MHDSPAPGRPAPAERSTTRQNEIPAQAPRSPEALLPYLAAVGVAAAGVAAARALVVPSGGVRFFVPLALIAVFAPVAGALPAAVSTGLTAAGLYYLMEARQQPPLTPAPLFFQLAAFVLVGILLSLIGGASRRSRARLARERSAALERAREADRAAAQLREAHQALTTTQEQYRLVNRATNDVLWDWDLVTDRLVWNDSLETTFGHRPADVPQHISWWKQHIHPEDRVRVESAIHAVIDDASEQVWTAEYRFRHQDGRWMDVLDRGFVSRDAAGRGVRMIGSMLDLTERKRAQEALRRADQEYRHLADAMPQLVWMNRPDGGAEYYNRQWSDYTGTTLEGAAGDSWSRFLHPDDQEPTLRHWRRCLATGEPYETEYRLRRARDGAYRWFLARALPVRDEGGRIVRWFGTCTDIDDQKGSETKLEEEKARLDVILASLPVGVFIADAGGRLVETNERGRAIWGGAPMASRPSEYAEYKGYWPDTGKRLAAEEWALARAVLRGETVVGEMVDIERFDGTRGTILNNAAPFRDAEGNITGAVVVILDVTDFQQAQNALREADRRKTEFLAMLSHELRNPLAPIRTGLHIVDRSEPGSAQARRAVEVIDRQVSHMTRLIDDLLDVTRISRGKILLQRERLELRELIDHTVEDHRSIFSVTGVELEVSTGPEPLFVDGDRTRLSQVVGNLLANAAKFTPPGGRVILSIERDGRSAVVRVSDTGAGVPPGLVEKMFEPFVQGDATLDRSKGGLGLGLALVKGLVELHGGTVTARSGGPGKGSEFTVRLPLVPASARKPPLRLVAQRAEGARRGLRVLVIEDNVDAAESLREALGLYGHTAETANRGDEGIEKARRFAPDIVLCDIGLPGIDGFEVARRMKADPALAAVPLVALSGYAAPEDFERSKEAGFVEHLAKPPDLDRLEGLLWEIASGDASGSTPPKEARGV